MTKQLSIKRTAGTASAEGKLLDCLLLFSCAMLLLSCAFGLYSVYTLFEFFIKAIPTPLNQFRWMQ